MNLNGAQLEAPKKCPYCNFTNIKGVSMCEGRENGKPCVWVVPIISTPDTVSSEVYVEVYVPEASPN